MIKARLFALLQHITPQHALSRAAGALARCRRPWVKNMFIEWFVKRYNVDMSEALEENPRNYTCFNAFFTRPLKPDARPICTEPGAVVCPADGFISQLGNIEAGRIFQAKGQSYSIPRSQQPKIADRRQVQPAAHLSHSIPSHRNKSLAVAKKITITC